MSDIVGEIVFQLLHGLLMDQEPDHIGERQGQDQQDQEGGDEHPAHACQRSHAGGLHIDVESLGMVGGIFPRI